MSGFQVSLGIASVHLDTAYVALGEIVVDFGEVAPYNHASLVGLSQGATFERLPDVF